MEAWFFQRMGEVTGPLTFQELCEVAVAEDIDRDTLVRDGPEGDWVRAEKVPGLFSLETVEPETPPLDVDKLFSEDASVDDGEAPPSP